jgi:hypothetical protein
MRLAGAPWLLALSLALGCGKDYTYVVDPAIAPDAAAPPPGAPDAGPADVDGPSAGPPDLGAIASRRDGGDPLDAGEFPVVALGEVRKPDSPARVRLGGRLRTSGVVTAVKGEGKTHSIFIQTPTATSWAGLMVFVGQNSVAHLAPGTLVEVAGELSRYRGMDQLDTQSGFVRVQGGAEVPEPIDVAPEEIATGGPRVSELQAMLVRVKKVVALTATSGTDFKAQPGDLWVTSFVANDTGSSPFPAAQGQSYSSITGVVYVFGAEQGPFESKIAPRNGKDLVSP